MKTTVEITLKSLSLSGIPEKALLISRNLLTVEMIWPKAGTPQVGDASDHDEEGEGRLHHRAVG